MSRAAAAKSPACQSSRYLRATSSGLAGSSVGVGEVEPDADPLGLGLGAGFASPFLLEVQADASMRSTASTAKFVRLLRTRKVNCLRH